VTNSKNEINERKGCLGVKVRVEKYILLKWKGNEEEIEK